MVPGIFVFFRVSFSHVICGVVSGRDGTETWMSWIVLLLHLKTPRGATQPKQPQPLLVAELLSDAVRQASCSPPPCGDDFKANTLG